MVVGLSKWSVSRYEADSLLTIMTASCSCKERSGLTRHRMSLSSVTMLYFHTMSLRISMHLLSCCPPADVLNSYTRKSAKVRTWATSARAPMRSSTLRRGRHRTINIGLYHTGVRVRLLWKLLLHSFHFKRLIKLLYRVWYIRKCLRPLRSTWSKPVSHNLLMSSIVWL